MKSPFVRLLLAYVLVVVAMNLVRHYKPAMNLWAGILEILVALVTIVLLFQEMQRRVYAKFDALEAVEEQAPETVVDPMEAETERLLLEARRIQRNARRRELRAAQRQGVTPPPPPPMLKKDDLKPLNPEPEEEPKSKWDRLLDDEDVV